MTGDSPELAPELAAVLSSGLWTVLATPFAGPDAAVDPASLTRETQAFAAAGAVGLVALGGGASRSRSRGRRPRPARSPVWCPGPAARPPRAGRRRRPRPCAARGRAQRRPARRPRRRRPVTAEALAATLAAWRTGGFPAAHAAWAPWLPLATFEQQAGVALALRKQLLDQHLAIVAPH